MHTKFLQGWRYIEIVTGRLLQIFNETINFGMNNNLLIQEFILISCCLSRLFVADFVIEPSFCWTPVAKFSSFTFSCKIFKYFPNVSVLISQILHSMFSGLALFWATCLIFDERTKVFPLLCLSFLFILNA